MAKKNNDVLAAVSAAKQAAIAAKGQVPSYTLQVVIAKLAACEALLKQAQAAQPAAKS